MLREKYTLKEITEMRHALIAIAEHELAYLGLPSHVIAPLAELQLRTHILNKTEPGDLELERREWEITNAGSDDEC